MEIFGVYCIHGLYKKIGKNWKIKYRKIGMSFATLYKKNELCMFMHDYV